MTPSPPTFGIRWKLLALMMSLVLTLWVILTLLHVGDQRRTMQQDLDHSLAIQKTRLLEQARILAHDLRRQAENDIAAFSFSSISATLKDATRTAPDLSYAILMDATPMAHVHTLHPELEQEKLADPPALFAASQASSATREYGEGAGHIVEFIEPIRFGSQLWGSLRLGFSMAGMNRQILEAQGAMKTRQRALLLRQARISAAFLACAAVIVLLLSARLTRPIQRLTQSAIDLARGDFSAARRLPIRSSDEIGLLSQTFMSMAGKLEESHSRLAAAAEEAKRMEAFLDSIIENLPSVVFVKDAEHLRYVRINRAGEEMLGLRRGDIVGKCDHDLFPGEIADSFTAMDREVLRSGRLLDIPEEPLATKGGAMRYVHTQKIPIAGGDGAPRYLLGIATDITSLKQAQDERRLFFTHALDLLCIADLDGHFLQLNPAFETTLGYAVAELLRRPFIDFVHPDDVEATQAATARLAEGRDVVAFENRYVCKDGSCRWLLWSATADPVARRIYAAARDVTERRELERQVIQIGTAEQERIAHDLHDGLGQTLTGLALKAQMTFYDLTEAGKPEAAARAQAIVDLANMASAQSRALARGLDPVMLEEGLPAALQDLAQTTSEILAIPCTFETDRFDTHINKFESIHLYRIAQEAVNNAVRHARPSTVSVALTSRGGQISLTVSDDGRGFDGSAGRTEGMGLRNMRYRARMIGAVVSILPNAKGGTTVICTLQRTPVDGRRAPAGREGGPP